MGYYISICGTVVSPYIWFTIIMEYYMNCLYCDDVVTSNDGFCNKYCQKGWEGSELHSSYCYTDDEIESYVFNMRNNPNE